ncbi:unnamed protein product [Urochloa humidicola]
MAANQDTVLHTDSASISLLRRLRAGAAVHFVHHLDVCSAAPADLVANLEPAPGTDGTWYFYCPRSSRTPRARPPGTGSARSAAATPAGTRRRAPRRSMRRKPAQPATCPTGARTADRSAGSGGARRSTTMTRTRQTLPEPDTSSARSTGRLVRT